MPLTVVRKVILHDKITMSKSLSYQVCIASVYNAKSKINEQVSASNCYILPHPTHIPFVVGDGVFVSEPVVEKKGAKLKQS